VAFYPTTDLPGVVAASSLLNERVSGPAWCLDQLLGRFVELSGDSTSANLTITADLIREAQTWEEPVVWIAGDRSIFFPPDLAESGVDLDALPVIRANTIRQATHTADMLMRSGGFALVVMDLEERRLSIPIQTRLTGLAQKHHTALLCLTRKEARAPAIGSLVSLRSAAEKIRLEADRFNCRIHVIKDKRRGPGWEKQEPYHGPEGLC
jgi:recombination protein RecA